MLKNEIIESDLIFMEKNFYKGYKILKGNTEYINQMMADENYIKSFVVNEYILIQNIDDNSEKEMRFDGEKFIKLRLPPSDYIKGKNALQRCGLDLLNNKNITACAILGGYGSGKAIIDDAKIPTPNGIKKMGDIKIGDIVFDRLGNETKVIDVFPQGELDCYEVEFSDGRKVYCNDEHLWTYITSKGNFKTVPLKEIIKRGIKKSNKKKNRYYIPICSPVQYSKKELSLNPYLMGYIIGNGCLSEKPFTISSVDADVINKIKELLGAKDIYHYEDNYSYSFYMQSENGRTLKFQTKEVLKDFPSLITTAEYKFIPDDYKRGSVEQRIELLRGLLDSDGSIDKKGRVSFCSISKQLILDISELCYSLGFSVSERKEDYREKYKNGVCYSVQIVCSPKDKTNIFYCKRKREIALKYFENSKESMYTRKRNCISIINVKKVGRAKMTCILVDNPEHLFLANDYIVTHNTYISMKMGLYGVKEKDWYSKMILIREALGSGKEVGFLKGDLEDKTNLLFLPLAQQLDGGEIEVDILKRQGVLESNIFYYLKGTTYNNAVMIVDEAEDLTEDQIKLAGTRIGESGRIVFSGDYKQDEFKRYENNPLVKMCNELKGNPLFGCIYLGEDVRSTTSKMFANLFE